MVALKEKAQDAVISRTERDVKRWSGYIDSLLQAFHRAESVPPSIGSKMEELRNKRDCVLTKVEALKHHKRSGWQSARKELDEARRELRDAWRTIIGTLDKESLFV